VSVDEAGAILRHAWAHGVDTLDTAPAYGESEQRLGEIGVGNWRVISKLPVRMPRSSDGVAGFVDESVHLSLERLKIARLGGLLLHRSEQLLGQFPDVLLTALQAMKSQGLVEKIGVSIYGPDELDAVWPHFQPDLVQAPFNVFDRRLLTSGWLARLHEAGTEVHVRSIFLQGLLLMEPERLPAMFTRWQSLWQRWSQWLRTESLTPLEACVGFASSSPEVGRIVVGVDNLKQLDEILVALKARGIHPPAELACEDQDLVDPSRWVVAA
jgi:aryl-alcohol dehydrogenase-like predicted oxidoreductase